MSYISDLSIMYLKPQSIHCLIITKNVLFISGPRKHHQQHSTTTTATTTTTSLQRNNRQEQNVTPVPGQTVGRNIP